MVGACSSTDPYIMPEMTGTVAGNRNYGGRTQVSPVLVGGENTGVMMVISESTASNVVNSLYSPSNATKCQTANPYNGGVYQSAEPFLGCTTNSTAPTSGNFLFRVQDSLITNVVYARHILQPLGVSGTKFADWAVGGAINGRIGVGYARLQAAGLTPTGVYIMLGANDTPAGTSQVSATASLTSIVSTVRTFMSCPIFVAKHSIFGLATSANVQAAQAAVLSSGNQVYFGGDADSLTSGLNYWDNTHFNATGAAAFTTLAVTEISAHP